MLCEVILVPGFSCAVDNTSGHILMSIDFTAAAVHYGGSVSVFADCEEKEGEGSRCFFSAFAPFGA